MVKKERKASGIDSNNSNEKKANIGSRAWKSLLLGGSLLMCASLPAKADGAVLSPVGDVESSGAQSQKRVSNMILLSSSPIEARLCIGQESETAATLIISIVSGISSFYSSPVSRTTMPQSPGQPRDFLKITSKSPIVMDNGTRATSFYIEPVGGAVLADVPNKGLVFAGLGGSSFTIKTKDGTRITVSYDRESRRMVITDSDGGVIGIGIDVKGLELKLG